jgi:hypothetical protein
MMVMPDDTKWDTMGKVLLPNALPNCLLQPGREFKEAHASSCSGDLPSTHQMLSEDCLSMGCGSVGLHHVVS